MFLVMNNNAYNLDAVTVLEPCKDGAARLHWPNHTVDIVFPDTDKHNVIDVEVLARTISALGHGCMEGSEFEKAYRVTLEAKRRAGGKFVGYVR